MGGEGGGESGAGGESSSISCEIASPAINRLAPEK